MIILGIDPGTATTGFGVIHKTKPGVFEILKFGVITTPKDLSDSKRLLVLAQDLQNIVRQYKPNLAGVEKLFFTTNQKTAIAVAQSRGAALLTLEEYAVPVLEFTPLQVKSTLCGYGKASKQQVQFMIKQTFKLQNVPKPDDAADALAIALCTGLRGSKK